MVSKSIKEDLLRRHTTETNTAEWGSQLDFEALVAFLENDEISLVEGDLIEHIGGIATFDHVYISENYNHTHERLYFIILHEVCHGKRFAKMGKKYHIDRLSYESFEDFVSHIVYEEILADRYASFVFRLLNGKDLDSELTQNLHLEENVEKYKPFIGQSFNQIKGDEDKFDELVQEFFN